MALQKPLKTPIGLLSLAYNQAVIPINTPEGAFLRQRHESKILILIQTFDLAVKIGHNRPGVFKQFLNFF
jgi:hypothetical protein